MDHIGKIIQMTIQQNTPGVNTGNSSGIEPASEKPLCPVCRGAGFYHPRDAGGRVDYSKVTGCKCLDSLTSGQKKDLLARNSNLGPLLRLSFDNLVPEGRTGFPINQKLFKNAYLAARDYASSPSGWLVFIGPSGSGKTHLACAIAAFQVEKERPVWYLTVPDLLEQLRSNLGPENDGADIISQAQNAEMLILDDLGVHSGTPWARERLDQLLSYRFNRQLPTVICAGNLEELDERLRTRLNNPSFCRINYLEAGEESSMGRTWDSGLELQKKMTFENFDWKRVNLNLEQRENLERAYRLAMDYARSPDGWLVWQGVIGSGKTHLASAIVNYLYQAGQQAIFIVVGEFIDHLRSAFSPDSRLSYDRLFEKVKTAPFLVLDDFGEQSTTPWAQEKLFQVINYRYNARLATVITTTRSLDELDSRIRSRLLDPKISMLFALSVPDYRTDLARRSHPKSATRPRPRR